MPLKDSQQNPHRIQRANINVEFFAEEAGREAPEIEAIEPDLRTIWHPTSDKEDTTTNSELNLGVDQLVTASGKVGWSRTLSRDVSDGLAVMGARSLANGSDVSGFKCANWTLLENEKRKAGVPDLLTTAVLVRREDERPFHAKVTLDLHTDMATKFKQFFEKIPMDDPILFNPKAPEDYLSKIRTQDVLNLGAVDLFAISNVRKNEKSEKKQANTGH